MTTSRIFIELLVLTFTLFLQLGLIQLMSKKFRSITDPTWRQSDSYTSWIAGLLLAGVAAYLPVLQSVHESLTILYRQVVPYSKTNVVQSAAFIGGAKIALAELGVATLWWLFWQFIGGLSMTLLQGSKSALLEMISDNKSYFQVKSLVIISFMLIFISFYEEWLGLFLPSLPGPFYK